MFRYESANRSSPPDDRGWCSLYLAEYRSDRKGS